jgi:uncharacterized protein
VLAATTTVEVIQEFAHVHARRRGRPLAAELANEYAVGLAPLLQPDAAVVARGLAIWEATEALGAFDAVLAAAALEAGADALVSADAAFAGVPGLRHVMAGTAELKSLLAR